MYIPGEAPAAVVPTGVAGATTPAIAVPAAGNVGNCNAFANNPHYSKHNQPNMTAAGWLSCESWSDVEFATMETIIYQEQCEFGVICGWYGVGVAGENSYPPSLENYYQGNPALLATGIYTCPNGTASNNYYAAAFTVWEYKNGDVWYDNAEKSGSECDVRLDF